MSLAGSFAADIVSLGKFVAALIGPREDVLGWVASLVVCCIGRDVKLELATADGLDPTVVVKRAWVVHLSICVRDCIFILYS